MCVRVHGVAVDIGVILFDAQHFTLARLTDSHTYYIHFIQQPTDLARQVELSASVSCTRECLNWKEICTQQDGDNVSSGKRAMCFLSD